MKRSGKKPAKRPVRKKAEIKSRNPLARALAGPQYRARRVKVKKGKGAYSRVSAIEADDEE